LCFVTKFIFKHQNFFNNVYHIMKSDVQVMTSEARNML
jgi:hypothetical protein